MPNKLTQLTLLTLASAAALTICAHPARGEDNTEILFEPDKALKEESPVMSTPTTNAVVETVQEAPPEVEPVVQTPQVEAMPKVEKPKVEQVVPKPAPVKQTPKATKPTPTPQPAPPAVQPEPSTQTQQSQGFNYQNYLDNVLGEVVVDMSDPSRTPERGELITRNVKITSPWGDRTKFLSKELLDAGASRFHRSNDFAWAHEKGADRTNELVYFAPGEPGDEFRTQSWTCPNGGGEVLDLIYTKGSLKGKVIRVKHLSPEGRLRNGAWKWQPGLKVAHVGDTGIGAYHGDITVINHSGPGRAVTADAVAPRLDIVLSVLTGKHLIAQAKPAEPEPPAIPPPTTSVEAAGGGGAAQVELDYLFEGGADSLVAITVGSAEGTRTPSGDKTKAYHGHTDPGNGVWNLGSFSYQHEAKSPEDADVRQLKRIRGQTEALIAKAKSVGLTLSLDELINGIDLANQAPAAALDRGGYWEKLKEAKELGKTGDDAIHWARAESYRDPDTGKWNAPGLQNDTKTIYADQLRRMGMIKQALTVWREKNPDSPTNRPVTQSASVERATTAEQGAVPKSNVLKPGDPIPEEGLLDMLLSIDLK